MSKDFVGSVIAFRGDDEWLDKRQSIIEVTDRTKAGEVEIAFDLREGRERIYLRLTLAELIASVMDERSEP